MRALIRIGAAAIAGATLYYAGIVNSNVILRPSAPGAVVVVVAIGAALAMLVLALRGTGAGEALAAPRPRLVRPVRAVWLLVSVMALVGLAWISGLPVTRSLDWTPYHNDAIALSHCAAELLLDGRDPYRELDLFDCYRRLGIGPDRTTPLRRGLFAQETTYPDDLLMDRVWELRSRGPREENVEFVWRPSYPSLSFVLVVPWVLTGWDPNLLYTLCLVAAMALVVLRAPPGTRPFILTALLGAACLSAFTVGGSADLLYALPLVAAWLWRERLWSALALGIAISVKQLAWFYVPFYAMQVAAAEGWPAALRKTAVAAAVFAAANLPFVLWDAEAWLLGVLTPVIEPMFPRGAGLVFLSVNGVLPVLPAWAYLGLEAAAALAALVAAWRLRHSSPELGSVLPLLPLFFGWRSLFSYFFLLPLFALAAIARMPLGELDPSRARASGGLTLLAMPRPAASRPRAATAGRS